MVQWKVIGGGDNGILVREGKDLKSAEAGRLANDSVLEELELAGERLKYQLVSGQGPSTGWISLKVKGKELVAKHEAAWGADFPALDEEVHEVSREDLDLLGPSTPPEERPYGIIVYGATGFTGMLAVQHLDAVLAAEGGPKLPWAIAGRNADKLASVKKLCKTEVAVLVVTGEEQEVHKMVGQCRVVISAIGPFSRLGEPVIRACVAFGTHYADVSGETWWLKRMIARYDAEARRRGVTLVPMCAQQATISDVATSMLVKKLGPLKQVRGYVLQMAFTTGGTDNTGRATMEAVCKNPHLFKDVVDPFVMGGVRKGGVRDIDKDCSAVEKDTLFPKFWLGPLGCAGTDGRCVRRSSALFEEARGKREMQYGEEFSFVLRDVATGKAAADRLMQMFGPLASAEAAPGALQAMLQGVMTGQSPPPGEGPPPKSRERFWVTYIMTAEGENGQWATCRYNGGDPYEVTSMCVAMGALTLLEEPEAVNARECGGIVTPAFAFASAGYVDRLKKHRWACSEKGASVDWDVKDGQPTQDEIMKKFTGRTQNFMQFTMAQRGGEVKQWALPDYAPS